MFIPALSSRPHITAMSSRTVFVNGMFPRSTRRRRLYSFSLPLGASGFNATWEIQTSLQKGYDVVATVPSHNKGVFLASLFGPTYGDRFGYIVTPRSRVSIRNVLRKRSISFRLLSFSGRQPIARRPLHRWRAWNTSPSTSRISAQRAADSHGSSPHSA